MTTHVPHPIEDHPGHNADLVAGTSGPPPPAAEKERRLDALYADFDSEHLMPLWTQLAGLMPQAPRPRAIPYVWRWKTLLPLAARAGDLVPVGRAGAPAQPERVPLRRRGRRGVDRRRRRPRRDAPRRLPAHPRMALPRTP